MNLGLEEELKRCTVKITVPGNTGWGTGFFVAPGILLTCAHVVRKLSINDSVLIHYQRQANFAEASIIQLSPQHDLALLRCTPAFDSDLSYVFLDETIQSGTELYFFGYPDKDFPNGCPVTGICEGLTGDVPPLVKFKLGQVRPGMSGSALLNQQTGKVCGIVKFTRNRTYDLGGGAITSSVILKEFPELQELQRQTHSQTKRSTRISNPPDSPANLPRSGVVKFVGRKETVIELHQLLQQSERVAVSAIAGMGGIGKTELALQYALSYQQTYSGGICWLQSRSGDVGTQIIRFVKSHLDLIPSSGMELIDQVKYCWRNWPTGKVLLVFDNVTDYESLQPYLPPSNEPRFKVLMTTRKRIGISVHELQLDVLDEAAALYLLKTLAGDERIQSQVDAAKQICLWLGYLPLGLELVGRYLARKTDLPLVDLLDRLRQQQLAAKALCQTEADMTAKRGVASAFQLSWQDLSLNAQQLGCGLSLFAATPIPWSVVEECFIKHSSEDLEEFRDSELINSNLIQRIAPSTYQLHPLIREFFQSQLSNSLNADEMKEQFCQKMSDISGEIPLGLTLANKRSDFFSLSVPHIISAATKWKNWLSRAGLVQACTGLGHFYHSQGLFEEAYPWRKRSLEYVSTEAGENSIDHLSSLMYLGSLKFSQGHYEEAADLWRQALNLTGENNFNAATLYGNLAEVYRIQSKYQEAEPLFYKSLEIKIQLLGEIDIHVAKSQNNLGALYFSKRNYAKAKEFLQDALDTYKRLVGINHPDTAQTFLNLGDVYKSEGNYNKAERYHRRALSIREDLFGDYHPLVATSCLALGMVYMEKMCVRYSGPFILRALSIRRKTLNEAHPDLFISIHCAACFYYAKHLYEKAEALFREAFDIAERQDLDSQYVEPLYKTYKDLKLTSKLKKKRTGKKTRKGFG